MGLDPAFFPTQHRHRSLYQDWDRFDTSWLFVLELAAVFLYILGLNQSAVPFSTVHVTRVVDVILAASTVPLLYLLGRELFLQRPAALLAAGLFLTQWGVLEQQRHWIHSGYLTPSLTLSLSLLSLYSVLRSRRDLRWTLGIGMGLGWQACLDPVWMVAFVAIATGFMIWDTPRILGAKHFWWGTGLGLVAIALGLAIRQEVLGVPFWDVQLWNVQSQWLSWMQTQGKDQLSGLFTSGHLLWHSVTFLVLQSFPWICFWPMSLAFLVHHYNLSWGRLCFIWGGLSLPLAIAGYHGSTSQIYVVLALVCGVYLSRFWQVEAFWGLPHPMVAPLPAGLRWGMGCLAGAAWLQVAYQVGQTAHKPLLELGIVVAIATTGTSILAIRHHPLWLPTLIWGTYCCLLLAQRWL